MAEKLSEIQLNLSRYFHSVGGGKNDKVISLGDTLTAYGAGVCAFLSGIPFYHIEAGLRTGVWNSPYPEEALRRSLTAFSTAHFTTTADARRNLCKEGVLKGRIFEVGNTVYDSIHRFIDGEYKVENKIVFTLHRRENANSYSQILAEISKFAKENRDTRIVYPVHKSKEVRAKSYQKLSDIENVEMTEPLSPDLFYNHLATAAAVITDSGGIEEECAEMGVPIIVLRRETERTREAKSGKIILENNPDKALALIKKLIKNRPQTRTVSARGGASAKIAGILLAPIG